MTDIDISMFSLNTNGLGNKTKRIAVFEKLRKKGKGIYMLQETHSSVNTEATWKREWGSNKVYFSHGKTNEKGVCIMLTNEYDIQIVQQYCDNNGHYIILDVQIDNCNYTIGNLYAPTRDKEKEQQAVFKAFCSDLDKCDKENVLIGGDFNVYMNPRLDKLDSMPDSNDNPHYRNDIVSYLEVNDIVDIWRVLNPYKHTFTWHRGAKRSRLDYFFVSTHLLNIVDETKILPGIHSDHSLIKTSFKSGNSESRGRGFWKFNVSLLSDHVYVTDVKRIIHEYAEVNKHMQDKGLLWELIKVEIRMFTMKYASLKKKERCNIERNLELRYTELHEEMNRGNNSPEITEEFYLVKNELEVIEKHHARGLMVRSKSKWVEEGERNTSYFLRLEKNNYCNKHITKLNVNDSIITNATDILNEEKQFYENLYSDVLNNEDELNINENTLSFTNNPHVPQLNDEQKQYCEENITESELLVSLKALPNSKTPGTDGFSAEFYKFFWIDVKELLLDSINYGLEHGYLSVEQRRGVITLIPKKDKDRLFLKNWRPITLLNVDYKLLAKTLASRISKLLPMIISEDQTGYIKGRFIGCNIRLIEDIMFYTDTNNIPGILLTVDFEKAFDSIRWNFIASALKSYNFGPNFIGFIKCLYNDISTCVINNGHISEWFRPQRGVRQGCPISPYLFILAVELLAISIREDENIKGIKINQTEIKISQLADDTTCFTQDIESIGKILDVFEKFRICAGLKVNVDKTKASYLGSLRNKQEQPFGLDWTQENISALGVIFTGKEKDHYLYNYKSRLKNMENLLNSWKGRYLSLKGKITVINNLALSPLIYLASVIHVPDLVIQEVKRIILDFIWDGKTSKIAFNTIIQNIEDGGLKLSNFEDRVKMLKVNWVKRLTDCSNGRWKAAPTTFYSTDNLTFYFSCNMGPVKNLKPMFYKDIHNYWSEVQIITSPNAQQIRNQILWNNRYITVNKQPVEWKKWKEQGIVKVDDILDNNGGILNEICINEKFNVNCNFMNVLQLRQSIPIEWRRVLYDSKESKIYDECTVCINNMLLPLYKIYNKDIYQKFVSQRKKTPSCIAKWTIEYPDFETADPDLWPNIFTLAFKSVRETKLQSFQYRILHRTITCNKKLYEMKIKSSPDCDFCTEVDTLKHFFLFCPQVRQFWQSFFTWWSKLTNVQFDNILEECLLFGFQESGDLFQALNFCTLNAKYYIYRQRLNKNNIDLYEFLIELKYKLKIEQNVCIQNNTTKAFDKFLFIYENL